MAYFKDYPYITENLDQSYDPFIAKLKEIIVITDQLFATQIHPTYGVYPKDFQDWLKKNPNYTPDSLSVTRIESGEVVEIPFSIYYKDANQRVAKLFDEASTTIDGIKDKLLDKQWWKEYMRVIKKAYLENNWSEAEQYFITTPADSPLLLSIGPIDTYHDLFKGKKQYYSAWLLVNNNAGQEQSDRLCKELITLQKSEDANDKSNKITFYIGDILFAGGEVAKHRTMGWSRSENVAITKKLGSLKMIAFNKLPYHTKRMADAMDKSFSKWEIDADLREAIMQFHNTEPLIPLVLHEFSHTFQKSLYAQDNLKQFYTDIEEARANTYMVHFGFYLERHNHLSKHAARNMFLRVLLYLPYLYEEYTVRNQRESYYFAGLFWLDKALTKGIIAETNTLTLRNEKLEESIEELISESLEYLFDAGDKGVAQSTLQQEKERLFTLGQKMATKLSW
jgi:hypothetical protein